MKKRILITGAGGHLGTEIIRQLLHDDSNYRIVALTSNPQKLLNRFANSEKLIILSNESLKKGDIPWNQVFIVIHLAFSRRFCTNAEIANSLLFAQTVFSQAKEACVKGLINVSSQSVYGHTKEIRTETTEVSPEMIYAMAKYGSEVILSSIFQYAPTTRTTNIRMDSIATNQNLLPSFVKQAFEKQCIKLIGGNQLFSLLDVRDAASALISLCKLEPAYWKQCYNVGINRCVYNLKELAQITAKISEKYGSGKVNIILEESNIEAFAGMDSTTFMRDTGWEPRYFIEDIVERVVIEYLGIN